jgi:hypothetical protein
MSSKSQTNANRTNAKESTNPRTGYPLGQGKARSSRNSTVHGLTGKSPILPGENPADLLDLAGRYRTGLHPDRQVEEDLVERMAIATYRLRRIARIEVGYFDLRLRYQSVPEQINQDGRADPLAFAYHSVHLDFPKGSGVGLAGVKVKILAARVFRAGVLVEAEGNLAVLEVVGYG